MHLSLIGNHIHEVIANGNKEVFRGNSLKGDKIMAHQEACQLYIEQEIKEGLAQGKTPYSIGKELTAMIEKMFETSIPADTLKKRAQRMAEKLGTNVPNPATTGDHSENLEKRQNQPLTNTAGQFVKGTTPGPGRPSKYSPPQPYPPYTNAIYIADIAISQLERITADDPKREKAFKKVIDWINEQLSQG